jgi:hypothetical protein
MGKNWEKYNTTSKYDESEENDIGAEHIAYKRGRADKRWEEIRRKREKDRDDDYYN